VGAVSSLPHIMYRKISIKMKKVMTVRAVITTLVKYVPMSMANLDSLSLI